MPRIIETTVYTFDELSDDAKEQAREWYRQGALDYDWHDCIIDDAKTIGALMGIDISNVYFSGFASQGDGACFTGNYYHTEGALAAVTEYAPVDLELHRIAAELEAMPGMYASVAHRGHYYHEHCTDISIGFDGEDENEDNPEHDEAVTELLRDFMRWTYAMLEAEHDYLLSDESVDEIIRANEYTFTEDGEREG